MANPLVAMAAKKRDTTRRDEKVRDLYIVAMERGKG
jgi:hypothetical protein